MKFPKLNLIVSNNELRPQLAHVQVGKEYTFATDAQILVRHKTSEIFNPDFVESLPRKPILIPGKAIYLVCQKATIDVSLSDNRVFLQLHRLDGSIILYRLSKEGYLNANSIIPDPKDCQPLSEIGINSNLLNMLSDGLGCNQSILRLKFFAKHKAIYVTSINTDYPSAIGLIMPVNIF